MHATISIFLSRSIVEGYFTLPQELQSYQIFDHTLLLLSEHAALASHIDVFMESLRSGNGQHSTNVDFRLAIFNAPRNKVIVSCPEVGLTECLELPRPAWIWFRRLFMRLVINESRPHYVMHASCVANAKGEAAIVTGSSDSGKTSTLIALLKRGYHFVCDDYTPIHFDDHMVRALPVGATAGARTFDMFPELEALKHPYCRFRAGGQSQWTINLGDMSSVSPAYSCLKPTHFFFVEPHFGGSSSLEPMSEKEFTWRMQDAFMGSPPTVPPLNDYSRRFRERSYELIADLGASAKYFKLMNGTIEETSAQIEEVFGPPRP
jgi:hypothetical protein